MKVPWPKGGLKLLNKNVLVWQRLASGVFAIAVICLCVYGAWHYYSSRNTTANIIKRDNAPTLKAAQNSLKTDDYENYQGFEVSVSQSYLTNNDIKDAEVI